MVARSYNLERPNYSKGGKTPWHIAQEDHPDTDFSTYVQSTSVIDLDQVVKYELGGQPLPVLPGL